jgi:hypothetical protein
MKTIEILRAIYNDKPVLKKFKQSMEEYTLNLRSMEQLRNDSKEIEKFIKETYGITPGLFKKIVKSSLTQNDNTDEIIDELQMIREIAKAEDN